MTYKKLVLGAVAMSALLAPSLALAALSPNPTDALSPNPTALFAIVTAIAGLVSDATPIAFAAGLLVFFWGLAKSLHKISGGAEKAQEEAGYIIKWGVGIMFVAASLWGIVAFGQTAIFGGKPTETFSAPCIKGLPNITGLPCS